ncbi:uncharacterized protein LOC120346934 [Styela clava]|uniref:uncharacterized protein LOC120346934 isoform X1 n=1 Tax=Styela clava TaxID=7725 RepID=UPI0019392CCC|nr:uncharacterized protein LOC120346934 isoform X1 [Styela clava]XP_039272662.1 uncharacterized protein LOC120346934 isoform X2 [Styela clava]
MPPLGSIFRSGSGRPKVDQHSLFTSIQVSVPVLQCNLQIYEPWKKKRVKPKLCQVTLYTNDTSPFLVWNKIINPTPGKSPRSPTANLQGGTNPDVPTCGKPRCVLPVSRAKVTKTTGGCFEVVDFATSAMFRFVAPTIYESEMWVKHLKTESQREANLDMGSICSSCSSSSSSHPSPVGNEYTNGVFSSTPSTPNGFSRPGYHTRQQSYSGMSDPTLVADDRESDMMLERPTDLFPLEETYRYDGSGETSTFPRTHSAKQRHTRAQPHLGSDVHTVEKHRPELGKFLHNANGGLSNSMENRTALPFSEYFVNLPNS